MSPLFSVLPTHSGYVSALHRELDSEGGVQSWTDFLKVRLHPRSVALLQGVWQGAADFSGFGHGRGALGSDEAREDALDRIRCFAEECDSLQACSLIWAPHMVIYTRQTSVTLPVMKRMILWW